MGWLAQVTRALPPTIDTALKRRFGRPSADRPPPCRPYISGLDKRTKGEKERTEEEWLGSGRRPPPPSLWSNLPSHPRVQIIFVLSAKHRYKRNLGRIRPPGGSAPIKGHSSVEERGEIFGEAPSRLSHFGEEGWRSCMKFTWEGKQGMVVVVALLLRAAYPRFPPQGIHRVAGAIYPHSKMENQFSDVRTRRLASSSLS